MKRILLGVLVVLFLACAIEKDSFEKGSFDWAMDLVEDYVNDWDPDAHLSRFEGIVDRDGLLLKGSIWELTFTSPNKNNCRAWEVDYDGNVKPVVFSYEPISGVVYDNERIRRVLAPVLQFLDDKYEEGTYHFTLSDVHEHGYAWIVCNKENGDIVLEAAVDISTYEIDDIWAW